MTSDERTVRGCCWGAGRLLDSLGVETDNGHAIEPTFQAHRREVEHGGEVDYVKLAAIHLERQVEVPTLW
jgi:hypothetical protein